MQYLKQSTTATVKLGQFLDDTDGKTAETALTLTQADIRISKNGGNIAQKNESTSCTHDELGIYGCPLDTTDTNTLGRLTIWVHESGALPVYHEFLVVTAEFYDTMCGSDSFTVDLNTAPPTAASVADAVWDEAISDHTTSTTFGGKNQKVVPSETINDYKATGFSTITAADVNAQCDSALSDYDAPTRAELTTDINSVITQVNANETKIDTMQGNVTDILADTNELQTDDIPGKLNDLNDITVAQIISGVADGDYDLQEMLRIMFSVLAGKSTGGGTTTIAFRDSADSKDRVSVTVDSNGNRTTIGTLDGS